MKKKLFYIILLIVAIIVSIQLIRFFNSPVISPILKESVITFNNKNNIHVTSIVWGIAGGHNAIVFSLQNISNKDINLLSNKEQILNAIVFFESEIFYKKEYDSLFIYLPSKSYSEEKSINKTLGNVKIKIIEYKASRDKEFEENFEKMNLKKIEVN